MEKIKDIFPMRIIKTVLAFFVSLVLAPYFYCDQFFAGLGSLRSMRESLTLSVHSLLEQVFANFLALVIAVISSTLFGINPFSVSLGLFILFLLIKKLDLYDSYMSAGVILVAITLLSSDQTELLNRSFDRFYSSLFGMLIALIVNSLLFKPRKADDITNILLKINEHIHIFMLNDLDEFAYLEIKNSLAKLESEKSIIDGELDAFFVPDKKKLVLQKGLEEINIVTAQCDVVFELLDIEDDFREAIIPVIIKLNRIKQYPQDKSEFPEIKKEIKQMYVEYTRDDNFFTNTKFLSDLNIYINLLRDYEITNTITSD